MFNSRIFSFRYLIALVLLVMLVAAVGNAAALTVNGIDHDVVEGELVTYAPDDATVTYSIDADGDVIANVAFTTESYDVVSASFTGAAGSYTACSNNTALPSNDWDCELPNAQAAAATGIYLVAAHD